MFEGGTGQFLSIKLVDGIWGLSALRERRSR